MSLHSEEEQRTKKQNKKKAVASLNKFSASASASGTSSLLNLPESGAGKYESFHHLLHQLGEYPIDLHKIY